MKKSKIKPTKWKASKTLTIGKRYKMLPEHPNIFTVKRMTKEMVFMDISKPNNFKKDESKYYPFEKALNDIWYEEV